MKIALLYGTPGPARGRACCTVAQLDSVLEKAGIRHAFGRATLAWLLKYDLLRHV